MLASSSTPPPTPRELRALVPGVARGLTFATARPRIHTGFPALDEMLRGGFPCGVVTEVVGTGSSGRTTLAHGVIATVTSAGELAACIDLPNALDPEHAIAAGVRLSRLLWIRPSDVRTAFRAAEHVLTTGGFRLVLLDLGGATVWSDVPRALTLRLARTTTRTDAVVLVLAGQRVVGSFALLCLEISRQGAQFSGGDGPSPLFEGIASSVHIRANKLGLCGTLPARIFATAVA